MKVFSALEIKAPCELVAHDFIARDIEHARSHCQHMGWFAPEEIPGVVEDGEWLNFDLIDAACEARLQEQRMAVLQ